MSGNGIWGRIREMGKNRRGRWEKTAAEVALVALFFLVFLFLLNFLFPSGTGLRSLIRGGDTEDLGAERTEKKYGPLLQGDSAPGTVPIAGYVSMTQNNVQSRQADAVVWKPAATGMPLHIRDAVQTAPNSSASIRVGGTGTIDLGEKSLVILQRMEKDLVRREKRSFLLMVDGELRGRIEGTREYPVAVNVASGGGVGRIVSRGGNEEAADFRVTVNPDRTTTYSVFQGTAEVEGTGRTVTVGSNQYTIVGPSAPPTSPAALPAAPAPAGPADGAEYVFRSLPPQVLFSWTDGEPAEAYRITLARDPGFRSRLVDEWVAKPSFTHGNLAAGTYYWRVSAKRGSIESGYLKTRSVRLVQSAVPPVLRAEVLPVPNGDRALVRGVTAPGASLLVAGKAVVPGEKGEFDCFVPLERGINRIVVESSDTAGNTAYGSLRVVGKY
ncbi:MAG: hypothetical protein H6Q83_1068 [Deltaproteobacteria bacterium]|nr:hypothetical protein [Deltaproteobacteria bacterium]